MKKLTPKQEAFANLIADGVGSKESYIRAYGRGAMSDAALRVQAAKTQNVPHVAARILELRQKLDDERTMKRIEKRLILAKIARAPNRKAGERMEAIKIDNVMAGHNEPERVEVFGMASLLDLVRKEAPKL